MAQERIGELPPRYSFALNPYNEWRCTKCPRCEQPTRLRKFALLIGVETYGLMVLGKTCRFCPRCEFIIAHQDELKVLLAASFAAHAPEVIGNEYYVIGTVERKTWRKGMRAPAITDEVLRHAADFEKEFDLHYEPVGWYPADRDTQ
jgi:hypothetical protein